ncbi:MAG TPA: hypothetical protein VFU47_08885, partial [Armatimonadota bacterium]|nr:hypothetical protein [Armatimonadota bacterium]
MMNPRTRSLLAIGLGAVLGSVAAAADLPTRFGALKLSDRQFDNAVSFKGRTVLRVDNTLSAVRTFKLRNRDAVLMEGEGGSGCPDVYYFITVSPSGARATREFGTCNHMDSVTQKGETIQVSMHGFLGPFEPAAARRKALKEKHVFTFRNGVVTEH